jgi:YD repeat-containing protein
MSKRKLLTVSGRDFRPAIFLSLAFAFSILLPLSLKSQTPLVTLSTLPGQTATRLGDGRWLLVGGETAGGSLNSVSIWDRRTGSTTALAARLEMARAWHTSTILPDGRVFIFGGVGADGQLLASPEVFNPETQAFEPLPDICCLLPRSRHTTTLLTDGSLLIIGGVGSSGQPLSSAELWDSFDDVVTTLPNLTTPRSGHSASLLDDGTVLIKGGRDHPGNSLANGDLFNPVTQEFGFLDAAAISSLTPPAMPYLAASLPVHNSVNVPTDSIISLRFSRRLNIDTVNSDTVTLGGPKGIEKIKVVVAEDGMLSFINPETDLLPGVTYTVTINGAVDGDRMLLPSSGITFSTEASAVSTQPPAQTASSALSKREPQDFKHETASDESDDGWEWKGKRKDGKPHSDWEDLPPLQAPAGVTALAGQVLDLRGLPLANVTLQMDAAYESGTSSVQTDETGRFLLAKIKPGWGELVIDGRRGHNPKPKGENPKLGYGVFEYGLEVKEAETNVLPFTIWLPRIDSSHAVRIPSPTTEEVIVTTPKIPGLELRIPPKTVIYDHEGRIVNEISITPIPVDRPPFPLPKNVQVPIYFTAQPGGAYVHNYSQGARLVYPNYVREHPGARFNFWHYTPEPSGWYIYGQGTVTADGKQVVPDPGISIYELTGAMINSGNSPPPNGPPPCDKDPKKCKEDGDPVDLATGLFVLRKTDLYLPDVLSVNLTRTYRQSDTNTRPFGVGTMHPYSIFLWSAQQYQEADLILPDGGRVHYVRTSPGTNFTDAVFEHRGPDTNCQACVGSPTTFYGSRIAWNGSGWDLTLKNGDVYVFGENAPLQAIRDRNGNQITITRTNPLGFGNITQITSPNGRWIQFTYDAFSRITQAADNMGRTVSYEYDVSGRLIKVTDPNNGITEYTYDSSHRMLTIKDARGIVFLTNQYDSMTGRVTRQTQADSGLYQFTYATDANGNVTQTDVTDPRGRIRRVTFNSAGYPVSDTRALGEPEVQTSTNNFQASTNLLLSDTDALGRQTSYTYDSKGNITSITRLAATADAVTTSYTYDPTFNEVATVTDPLNHSTTFGRDAKGNLISITNALNQTTLRSYNLSGQPISVTDPLNNTTQFSYDFGDLTIVTDPLGNTSTRFTDVAGRILLATDPLGSLSTYGYDVLNRLTQVTDPLNGTTGFTYDPNGNLLSVTDARSNATTYTYNNMDRLATRQDPLLRGESYQYDLAGNLTQFTDRKSQVTTYTYDGINRRTGVTYADSSTTTYTYDKGNRLAQVVDSIAGTITRTYDGLNRLTSETTPQGSVSYTYDAAGRRTSMTVAGQTTVNYTYDNANRLTQITQGSATVSYTYDAAGRRTSLTLPNGVLVEYTYDAASRVTSIIYKQNGTIVLGDLTYEYDKAGNRTKIGGSFARTGIPQAIASTAYNAGNSRRHSATRH